MFFFPQCNRYQRVKTCTDALWWIKPEEEIWFVPERKLVTRRSKKAEQAAQSYTKVKSILSEANETGFLVKPWDPIVQTNLFGGQKGRTTKTQVSIKISPKYVIYIFIYMDGYETDQIWLLNEF